MNHRSHVPQKKRDGAPAAPRHYSTINTQPSRSSRNTVIDRASLRRKKKRRVSLEGGSGAAGYEPRGPLPSSFPAPFPLP